MCLFPRRWGQPRKDVLVSKMNAEELQAKDQPPREHQSREQTWPLCPPMKQKSISVHVVYFMMYLHFAFQKKLIQMQCMSTLQTKCRCPVSHGELPPQTPSIFHRPLWERRCRKQPFQGLCLPLFLLSCNGLDNNSHPTHFFLTHTVRVAC